MTKVVPFKAPELRVPLPGERFNEADAIKLVRQLVKDSQNVVVVSPTKHAKKRQRQRSITRRQIDTCLKKGIVSEGPFQNERGNWQLNLKRLASGEQITCVIVIETEPKLHLIVRTAF